MRQKLQLMWVIMVFIEFDAEISDYCYLDFGILANLSTVCDLLGLFVMRKISRRLGPPS